MNKAGLPTKRHNGKYKTKYIFCLKYKMNFETQLVKSFKAIVAIPVGRFTYSSRFRSHFCKQGKHSGVRSFNNIKHAPIQPPPMFVSTLTHLRYRHVCLYRNSRDVQKLFLE